MFRRAQAMSEFLMTYGWAVLVVLVMIIALAGLSQLGIINSDYVVPEKCILDVGLACVDHILKEDGAQLRLINGFGKKVRIHNISIGENCSEEFNKNFDSGETLTFQLFNCSNGEKNSKFDADILIYYSDEHRMYTKKLSGSITSKIS